MTLPRRRWLVAASLAVGLLCVLVLSVCSVWLWPSSGPVHSAYDQIQVDMRHRDVFQLMAAVAVDCRLRAVVAGDRETESYVTREGRLTVAFDRERRVRAKAMDDSFGARIDYWLTAIVGH